MCVCVCVYVCVCVCVCVCACEKPLAQTCSPTLAGASFHSLHLLIRNSLLQEDSGLAWSLPCDWSLEHRVNPEGLLGYLQ